LLLQEMALLFVFCYIYILGMHILILIFLSTFLVSLISFIGALVLVLKEKLLQKILLYLVALSAGVLVGGAFLHLIPETIERFQTESVFIYILLGIILFLLIEKVLYWRHCHKGKCPVHTFTYMNLLGDAVHNFIDGLIIAASFVVDIKLGIASTFAIAFHEIPQEIGDFGVLVYGGFKKTKALFFNFLTALTAILGGLLGFYISGLIENFAKVLLPMAAGGFIYIALSDLIPEIRKEKSFPRILLNFIIFIFGILMIHSLKFIFPE